VLQSLAAAEEAGLPKLQAAGRMIPGFELSRIFGGTDRLSPIHYMSWQSKNTLFGIVVGQTAVTSVGEFCQIALSFSQLGVN
jgi:hypothetical protein